MRVDSLREVARKMKERFKGEGEGFQGVAHPMNLVACTVISNRELSPGNHLLTLKVPRAFAKPQPGQFIHLRVGDDGEPFLRRPYSLEGFFEKRGVRAVRIYFSVVGRGSKVLASQGAGKELDLIGPVGVGFAPRPRRTPILVAGGRGVAPLLFLSRRLRDRKRPFVFLFGARSRCRALRPSRDPRRTASPGDRRRIGRLQGKRPGPARAGVG